MSMVKGRHNVQKTRKGGKKMEQAEFMDSIATCGKGTNSEDIECRENAIIEGEWKMTVEEFSFAGCHYNSSCD